MNKKNKNRQHSTNTLAVLPAPYPEAEILPAAMVEACPWCRARAPLPNPRAVPYPWVAAAKHRVRLLAPLGRVRPVPLFSAPTVVEALPRPD